MNYELFTLINNMALQNHTLDQIMIGISQYVPIIMSAYLILLITWSFIYEDRSLLKNAMSVIILLGITLGVNYGLEHLIYTPRPFVEHTVHLVIPHSVTSSFPSTHAMATMAIALGVHHYYKRIGSVFITLSILTGLSRIYLGHHYPFDVIGGFAITYLLYILFNTYIKSLLMNMLFHTKHSIKIFFLKLKGAYSYDPFLVVLLMCTTILYLFGNGNLAITDPVESNYALTAKEMVLSGDYISPRIFDHYWYDKPIFFYLELVAAFKLFGFTDFAARFFPSLFGVANVYLIYSFTKRIMNRQIARIAAMMMSISAEAWLFSKAAITDSTLVFFFASTLICFYLGYERRKTTGSSGLYYYGAYVCAAFSVLTKGPVGFLLPGLIILVFLAVRKDIKELLHLHLISGLLIISSLGGSWYIYMYFVHGDAFITTFLGVHNWLRATVSEHPRDNVWYYYLMINAVALIPWTPMILVKAFKKIKSTLAKNQNTSLLTLPQLRQDIQSLTTSQANPSTQFLAIWAMVVILFFQAMATKYTTYTFPALMPMIMLCAYWWRNNETIVRKVSIGTGIVYIILTLCIAIPITHKQSDVYTAKYLTRYTQDNNTVVVDGRKKYHVSTTFYSAKTVNKLDMSDKNTSFDPNNPPLSWDVKKMMPIIHISQLPEDKKMLLITDTNQFPAKLSRLNWHLTHQGPEGDIYVSNKK